MGHEPATIAGLIQGTSRAHCEHVPSAPSTGNCAAFPCLGVSYFEAARLLGNKDPCPCHRPARPYQHHRFQRQNCPTDHTKAPLYPGRLPFAGLQPFKRRRHRGRMTHARARAHACTHASIRPAHICTHACMHLRTYTPVRTRKLNEHGPAQHSAAQRTPCHGLQGLSWKAEMLFFSDD